MSGRSSRFARVKTRWGPEGESQSFTSSRSALPKHIPATMTTEQLEALMGIFYI
jgi:hypothetical protein